MRISDWSSDVCSSDLHKRARASRACSGHGWRTRRDFAPNPLTRPRFGATVGVRTRTARSTTFRSDLGSAEPGTERDRKSVVEGKSGSVSVDLGGSHNIKKKKIKQRRS